MFWTHGQATAGKGVPGASVLNCPGNGGMSGSPALWLARHIPSCSSWGEGVGGVGGLFSGRGDNHTTFFPGKVHKMQIIPQVAEG